MLWTMAEIETELKWRGASGRSWVAESEGDSVATIVFDEGFYHWRLWSPNGTKLASGKNKSLFVARRVAERTLRDSLQ